jgi:hypothetical protein
MLVDLKKMTTALVPTTATTPMLVLGRIPEQQIFKPQSLLSSHRFNSLVPVLRTWTSSSPHHPQKLFDIELGYQRRK